jgi:hypothetical protein
MYTNAVGNLEFISISYDGDAMECRGCGERSCQTDVVSVTTASIGNCGCKLDV